MGKPLLFLSIDVEADGPAPGLNNLLSIGLAGFNVEKNIVWTFEANLKDIPEGKQNEDTMNWWKQPENQEAWDYVQTNREEPGDVFLRLSSELEQIKKIYKIIVVGWPINYDWMWLNYYFHRYMGENPLGFSARCIGTYAWALSKNQNPSQKIKDLDRWADPKYPHTHKALDDAKEQGALFMNMYLENID